MCANRVAQERHFEPVVSIIVPARNEEASVGLCLASLLNQSGISYEIIVVNDHSTDHTREIAESYGSVNVIDADPLPPGWTGKSHALCCGVRIARGDWFLFTDADTEHRPSSLRRAVEEAERHSADLLSYSPQQEVHSVWERSLMPVIFAELWRVYTPRKVRDPKSSVVAANGQYILIRRSIYEAIGGHEAVRDSLLEDVELARRAKRSGATIRFRYGRDAVKTRMYRSFRQMWEGWTKNLALLFPDTLRLAIMRAAEFALSFGGLCLAFFAARNHAFWHTVFGATLSALVTAGFFYRVRNAHFGWLNTIISPAGLPIFVLLLLRSRRHHLQNRVSWKGRSYAPASQAANKQPTESLSTR